ncbi:MAG: hypothetical protein HZB56_19210 [Deltaproteobacteria bacterium]|nr:hypothetical protein [Deltaproteobacteria bacterium]
MVDPNTLLSGVPAGLRLPLLEEFRSIVAAYAKGAWKMASLDGGRFCEVVYTILDGALSGTFAPSPSKPKKFVEACQDLTRRPKTEKVGDYSLRILLPRVLPALYEIRNNRNVGHVGGDVVANKMDSEFVRSTATWVLCELVRVFHAVNTQEAQAAVDALIERKHPLIWEFDGIRRVLDPRLSAADRTLLLLDGLSGWTDAKTLSEWVKYKMNFRPQVLQKLADELLIEYDARGDRVVITARGILRADQLRENGESPIDPVRPAAKTRRK